MRDVDPTGQQPAVQFQDVSAHPARTVARGKMSGLKRGPASSPSTGRLGAAVGAGCLLPASSSHQAPADHPPTSPPRWSRTLHTRAEGEARPRRSLLPARSIASSAPTIIGTTARRQGAEANQRRLPDGSGHRHHGEPHDLAQLRRPLAAGAAGSGTFHPPEPPVLARRSPRRPTRAAGSPTARRVSNQIASVRPSRWFRSKSSLTARLSSQPPARTTSARRNAPRYTGGWWACSILPFGGSAGHAHAESVAPALGPMPDRPRPVPGATGHLRSTRPR